MAPRYGVDPSNLAEAGWGVVWARSVDPSFKAALEPLLDLRRRQAGDLYHELVVNRDETPDAFLGRHGAPRGPADPRRLPYYLMLVGSHREIPLGFQVELDDVYAVGRLPFSNAHDFASYARKVCRAEKLGSRPGNIVVGGSLLGGEVRAIREVNLQETLSQLLTVSHNLRIIQRQSERLSSESVAFILDQMFQVPAGGQIDGAFDKEAVSNLADSSGGLAIAGYANASGVNTTLDSAVFDDVLETTFYILSTGNPMGYALEYMGQLRGDLRTELARLWVQRGVR